MRLKPLLQQIPFHLQALQQRSQPYLPTIFCVIPNGSIVTPERDLLRKAQRLESNALAEIYDAYSPVLYRYAMRLLGDVDLAEECVSETFTRFLQALKKRRGPKDHLQAYLFRIAHNWITDQYRRKGLTTVSLEAGLSAASGDDLEQTAFRNLRGERVRAALQHLTPDQRQVIVLKYLEGWENAEVAQVLDKPVGAVKSLQHRALAALKRILLDDENGPNP